MASWSNAMRLKEVPFFQGFLSTPGVYELGYDDVQGFDGVYIGLAGHSLYAQLYGFVTLRGPNKLINDAIKKDDGQIYCRVIRSGDPGYGEAKLIYQQELGGAGLYPWNRLYGRRSPRG